MSNPLKKQRAVYPIEDYNPEDEDEDIQDDLIGKTVNVDFDAFKAEDGDFHGIKRLLLQSFRGLDLDVSGLADIVISQNYVGSVVKQVYDDDELNTEEDIEDEDEIFGVSTVINLTSRKDEEPVTKLRTILVELCQANGSDSTNQLVRESLGNESKHVGFLISERLVNLPPQFALPVYESLINEMKEAKEKGMPYDFAYLVMICKMYKHANKKKKQQQRNFSPVDKFMWSNPEEEIFHEECIASFDYDIKGDTGLTGDWEEDDIQYKPFRRVLIFNGSQLPNIIAKVKTEIS